MAHLLSWDNEPAKVVKVYTFVTFEAGSDLYTS
jgi:hypothetical protein